MARQRQRLFLPLTGVALLYPLLLLALVQAEQGVEGSNIQGFGDAVWYSLVTLTTVGYGDFYPATLPGKLVGGMFVVASLGLIGFFVGTLADVIKEMRENKRMGKTGTHFEDHSAIVGWDKFARMVTRELVNAGQRVAVLTDDPQATDLIYDEFPGGRVFVCATGYDSPHSVERINLDKAAMVLVNLPDDTKKLIWMLNVKKDHPDAHFMIVLNNPDLTQTFVGAGVTYVLSKEEISSKMVASHIFEPDVAAFTTDILAKAVDEEDYDIQQYRVLKTNSFVGQRYGDVFSELKSRHNVLCLGISKTRAEGSELMKLPGDDVPVEEGDYLIMINNGITEKLVEDLFGCSEGV